jgi:serine/threonine-protein kinase RIO1
MVQNKKARRRSEILTIDDHNIVRSFKYLGMVISNTNDETEEIKARILTDNKPIILCKPYLNSNKSTEIIK